MSKPQYHVASFSGGKDSTAMVLHMIERGDHLDEVMFCNTSMEFPAMLRHVEKVKKVVEAAGIKFTTLRSEHDFEYYMLHHIPNRKKEKLQGLAGYSWPGPLSRWCTRALKLQVIARYLRELRDKYNLVQYVGIAADEGYRLERKNNQQDDTHHPLVEWGWDEARALSYCYAKGSDWEGLYEIFSRVSCWCCPLQSLAELRKLREHFPELWRHLKDLDAQTWRDFLRDGWSVERLDKRFNFEEELGARGYSLKSQRFYKDLRRHCFENVSLDLILKEREAEACPTK